MQKYSDFNLEDLRFYMALGYSSSVMKDKISPEKNYIFENIQNVSITPWYHNTCNHDWDIKKNSIVLIELPSYPEMFYLLNSKTTPKDEFVDKSLDIILGYESEFNVNSLRSAYDLMRKGNLIFPVSKNIRGVRREYYLFKSLIFNLSSLDTICKNYLKKYKNIEIIVGNTHLPAMLYLFEKFSNIKATAKEAVGKIKELSQFENYENYETISALSSQSLISCLNQINEALMFT